MRVLVTGGAGFIGSRLCCRLVSQGEDVICVDNLYTGSLRNLEPIKTASNFTFMNQDIRQPLNLKVEQIFNLACPASPPHYQRDPIYTATTSVLGALNMLELARRNDARILQSSTSEVYGEPEIHPQREEYRGNVNPIGIRACYDESKRMAETLFFDFQRQYKTAIKVIRIFNTYGPNMAPNDGRVVSNFIMQALCGEDITIYGDGTQTRSFCFVDDLVEGMLRMMDSPADFTGPVNLGNPSEFTVRELAQAVVRLTNSKSKIVFRPLPQDDPTRRRPSIDLAKRQLGWEPKIPLEEGLLHTIQYFQSLLHANPQ